MLFAVISGPTYEKALDQIQKAIDSADGFEFRLDYFEVIDLDQIAHLMKSTQKPIIFTLRKSTQGGLSFLPDSKRYEMIESLCATLQPDYVDLEYDTNPDFISKIAQKTAVICSYHNFEKTPENLEEIFSLFPQDGIFAYKITCMANSTLDALRMLLYVRKKSREDVKTIGICMGEKGNITRILGPLVGNFLTYACIDEQSKIAPGQLSLSELQEIYHYGQLNAETLLFGLIGDPITQSPSYLTHNAFFRRIGLNAIYVRMQVPPEELKLFFPLAITLGFIGLSVTIPLKEVVMDFIDVIDPNAHEMGAVNTIVFHADGLFGANTDAAAALDCIEERMTVNGKKMIILGAGGSAKAIAYEAKRRGAHLIILNRNVQRAEQLAISLNCEFGSLDQMKGYDILINTTPEPNPIDPESLISETLIMDINVRHRDTPLLKSAHEKNCEIIEGYEMFIRQAQGQFALWSENTFEVALLGETV